MRDIKAKETLGGVSFSYNRRGPSTEQLFTVKGTPRGSLDAREDRPVVNKNATRHSFVYSVYFVRHFGTAGGIIISMMASLAEPDTQVRLSRLDFEDMTGLARGVIQRTVEPLLGQGVLVYDTDPDGCDGFAMWTLSSSGLAKACGERAR